MTMHSLGFNWKKQLPLSFVPCDGSLLICVVVLLPFHLYCVIVDFGLHCVFDQAPKSTATALSLPTRHNAHSSISH